MILLQCNKKYNNNNFYYISYKFIDFTNQLYIHYHL